MIPLLVLPLLALAAVMHRCLQACAPSNVLARRVRAAPPRLGSAALLFVSTGAMLAGVAIVSRLVTNGAPGWLNLVVVLLAWNALKLQVLAVVVSARCAIMPQKQSRVFTYN